MTLQTRLLLALGALLVAFSVVGWAYMRGHALGDRAGANRVQSQWNEAKLKAEEDSTRIRKEGYTLASEYETQLHALEKRYANSSLRKANTQPVQCPASGRVGDILLPPDLIDGMFNRESTSADAPGPSASGANPSL